jgi:iron-sulfur cluster assembly protein
MIINLTKTAINEIKRLQAKPQNHHGKLLITVKTGGCNGLYYDLKLTQTLTEQEQVYCSEGIEIAIAPDSINYIDDLNIDYSEDLMGGAFRLHNSKALKTCSCGNSFSLTI